MNAEIKVFISYSHDSPEHRARVLGLADQLCAQGVDCTIDQYEESPEEGWIKWMEQHITESAYVLVVCTQGYVEKLNSMRHGTGKGVKWEGAIISQDIYDNEGRNRRFVPIIFGEQDKEFIPRMLKAYTYYEVLDDHSYEKLYRRVTKQPVITKPSLGNVVEFPPSTTSNRLNSAPVKQGQSSIKQVATGNNNIQIAEAHGGVAIHTRATPRISVLPAPGTIGSSPLLKQAITERFNKIGEEREKRFGKNAYPVMYKKFKSDFEIKKAPWTSIWGWPEVAADAIIGYLDKKYANTIAGRMEQAVEKGTMIPSKGHLYAREKELLSQLDLEISSPEVKDALHRFFQ